MSHQKFDRSRLPPAPNLHFERERWNAGCLFVAGVDEAGRGALAGPVAAAAVILPSERVERLEDDLKGVRDSKQMTAHDRESWAQTIRAIALTASVGFAAAKEIDTLGILPATHLAVKRAIRSLIHTPDHYLLDYLTLGNIATPQTSLVKGDRRSLSIAAASVLAKTTRDSHMRELAERYPGYAFASNKGYGTVAHRAALDELGPTPVHRYSFSPLKPKLL